MLIVSEVKTKKDIKDFVELPLKMYKSNPYFVPPIYSDEIKLIKNGGQTDIADSVFFIARRDGEAVGRIQGILHKQYNELKNEKRVRFTRFDSIDDTEVSRALFGALESWALEKGMEQICGPLGYNDLDREGLLIEGFDENNTYEEQYNYDYYPALVEDAGYAKEIDWLEFELTAPKVKNDMMKKIAKRALEMNKLHLADKNMSKKRYIEKYADGFFECLDKCYSKLYGTMPIPQKQRDELISQFRLVLNKKYLDFICDENENVVAFGVSFPSFGDALKKSGGRLTPPTLVRLLKSLKRPKAIDLGLIAVLPEYQNTGINAVFIDKMIEMLTDGKIEKCETNLNLETNIQVMSQWQYVSARNHKRRRAYLKAIRKEALV